ncbi:MAG: hypothetical protein LBP70_00320 [Mycoplasmataceae bacterium]|nr:hypothetical protein [Mycoplasmataceae bacterium]
MSLTLPMTSCSKAVLDKYLDINSKFECTTNELTDGYEIARYKPQGFNDEGVVVLGYETKQFYNDVTLFLLGSYAYNSEKESNGKIYLYWTTGKTLPTGDYPITLKFSIERFEGDRNWALLEDVSYDETLHIIP